MEAKRDDAGTDLPRHARGLLVALACMAIALFPPAASAKDLPVAKPVMACADLAETDVAPPGEAPARIVTAKLVTTGTIAPYCEVRGYVAPQVKFELRLPTENWTQRLMYSGCGGFCGRVDFRIRAAEDCPAVTNGELALVASDLGHDTPDGNADTVWAAANRQGKIDYGYRGVHVVTVVSKAIIARFYGRPQAYAYFNGCSDGGREGMMEVQRYPADFDGVVAGASVIHDTVNNTVFHAWSARHLTAPDGSALFRKEDLATLHKAAVDACDTTGDGVKDGLIGDPAACRFDPAAALCPPGRTDSCLSAAQVAAARAIYAGPSDESGKPLYFGRPVGSELLWDPRDVAAMANSFMRYMVSDEINSGDAARIAFDRASFNRYNALATIYNATDPAIDAFRNRGGKLVMWHGWADPGVPPMSSVDYHRALLKRYGKQTAAFARLFMLPGVGHCGGGDGPDRINLVDAIMAWVEDGVAPTSIQAVRKSYGRTTLTRAVLPYELRVSDSGK